MAVAGPGPLAICGDHTGGGAPVIASMAIIALVGSGQPLNFWRTSLALAMLSTLKAISSTVRPLLPSM